MKCLALSLLLTALAASSGCSVNPSTHEKSGPTVVFRQRESNISALFLTPGSSTPATFTTEPLACVATDPGGVQSISLSFTQTISLCVFSGGCGMSFCISDGATFNLSPGLPAAQTATSHPDSSGQVPNELFLLAILQGAYECTATAHDKTVRGEPFGQSVSAICSATNYSKRSSTVTIPVTFNPPATAACCTGSACQCNTSTTVPVVVCCANSSCHSDNSCH
jgi:hypothetical protein